MHRSNYGAIVLAAGASCARAGAASATLARLDADSRTNRIPSFVLPEIVLIFIVILHSRLETSHCRPGERGVRAAGLLHPASTRPGTLSCPKICAAPSREAAVLRRFAHSGVHEARMVYLSCLRGLDRTGQLS